MNDRSRVFHSIRPHMTISGPFHSILLFDPGQESAIRVYDDGGRGAAVWYLHEMENSSVWCEITDWQEVQNFLRENPLAGQAVTC